MRVGASPYVPMVRRPVVAAGGGTTAAPTPAAPPSAPATIAKGEPNPSAPQGSFDVKALGMKVQSFLSNIWDTVIGPFIKSLFGMFGG
ncbi:MAG TPA: hypothetical protein V6D05_10200 [Stenomitos sp.]